MTHKTAKELEEIEFSLLLEGIFRQYGFDFRDYAPTSLRRRVWKTVRDAKLASISALLERVLRDPSVMERLLLNISIDVTSMFRDPDFFLALRRKVVPLLRDLPFIRVWHAGCAGGEEVYSMAILLQEEGLLEKTRIYATDMNEACLRRARAGIFPAKAMQEYTANYQAAGGASDFSGYYSSKYDNAIFKKELQKNVVWAQHNLVTDASFNEFHVILCRNVMIYFNRTLQNRVHSLIFESLPAGGVLAVGQKESLKFTPHEYGYETLDDRNKLFVKKE